MSRKMKRSWAGIAVLMTAFAARNVLAAQPDVLKQVPADAAVVITVNDLKGFCDKVTNLATRMNVPGTPADLLGALSTKMGIAKGLDPNGSAAFVYSLVPPPKEGEAVPTVEKPYMLLLPTTDAKGMLESFKPSDPENGISEVTIDAAGGEPGYVSTMGKYVAFSPDKEFLSLTMKNKDVMSEKLSPEVAKAYDKNDLVVFANVPAFSAHLIQQIEAVKPMFKGMMAMGQPNMTDAVKAAAQANLEVGFDFFEEVLTDTDSAVETLRLNDDGATLGFAGRFKADSEIGKFMAAQKPLTGAPLDGFPAGDLVLGGAMVFDAQNMGRMLDFIWGQTLLNPKITPDDKMPDVKKAVDLTKQGMALINSMKFAFYAPTADQKGILHGAVLMNVSDAAKYLDIQEQMIKAKIAGATASNPQIKVDMTEADAPVVAKGLSFKKVTLTFTADPDRAEQDDVKNAMKVLDAMYGGDHLESYMAAVGNNQVLAVIGVDSAMLDSIADAAQSSSKALSQMPEIMAVSKEVLPNASVVAYLPVDRWITLGKQIWMTQMGMPAPAGAVAVGEKSSPVVVSIAVSGSNMVEEVHAPVAALSSITQAIKDAAGGMP